MKKFLSILVLIALVLSLSACGGKKEAAPSADLAAVLAEFKLGDEMMTLDLDDLVNLYFFDAAAYIKDILDARYEAKLNETENYLPDEYAIIKECSVTMDGNYVAMIVAPNAADLVDIYNASFEE